MNRILEEYVVYDREFDELAKIRKMTQEEFEEYLLTLSEDD